MPRLPLSHPSPDASSTSNQQHVLGDKRQDAETLGLQPSPATELGVGLVLEATQGPVGSKGGAMEGQQGAEMRWG